MIYQLRLFNIISIIAPPALSLATSWQSQSNRRVLYSGDNIGEAIRDQHSYGERAHFTFFPAIEEGSIGHGQIDFLQIDVAEAKHPAVTPNTIFIDSDGIESQVGNTATLQTLLVSDTSTVSGSETFCLLAIDPNNDELRGIVEPKGRTAYTISQSRELKQGNIMAVEEKNVVPPEWSCGVYDDIFDRRLDGVIHQHGDHNVRPYFIYSS